MGPRIFAELFQGRSLFKLSLLASIYVLSLVLGALTLAQPTYIYLRVAHCICLFAHLLFIQFFFSAAFKV